MKLKSTMFLTFTLLISLSIANFAAAQKYQPAGDAWITKWWSLGLVTQTGGFPASAKVDYLKDGTGGKYTHESASTMQGLPGANVTVDLPKNGGALKWKVVTIKPDDDKNMSTSWGKVDESNITWHGIIVIKSPAAKNTKMHVAHDDHAQLWLNGKLVYDDPNWTTAAKATRPKDISLAKGDNALLFKCGESGGADYVNLHFEKGDTDLQILPTTDDQFLQHLTPVEPKGKVAITWGSIKRK